jgi:AhpC/TSA family
MPVGQPVSDLRIHRRIGFWNGTRLSADAPKGGRPPAAEKVPLHSGSLLQLAAKDPKSVLALDAAAWILSNTPSGPDTEKALTILIDNHMASPELGPLCHRVLSRGSSASERLFRALLRGSPHRTAQAHACFALAVFLKARSEQEGREESAESVKDREEAAQLFDRVVKQFRDVQYNGEYLTKGAERSLYEVKYLAIGKVAPEIEGEDIDGKRFSLSDYRGKAVLLDFWSHA